MCECNNKNREEEAINLRVRMIWKALEGGDVGEAGGKKERGK